MSSATTTSSEGPASDSMPTIPATSRLAAVTYMLPGPTMTSTGRIVSVPYARAAIACAPPTRYTSSTPARAAAARVAVRDPAVTIGRHAQRDLRDARHACGNRRHEHGRGVGGPSAGHVQPGSIHRHDELAEEHAVPLEADVVSQLSFVVGGDFLPRVFEGGAELGGGIVERGEQLIARHPQLVDRAAVELLGQVVQRCVTTPPNLGDDRAHAFDGRCVNSVPTRRQRAEVGVRAAKIESGEHQGSDHRNRRPLTGCPNCPPSPNA